MHPRLQSAIAALFTALLLSYAAPARSQALSADFRQTNVQIDGTDGEVVAAREELVKRISTLNPSRGIRVAKTVITADGRQILYGDLFENHQICALVELPFDDEESGIGVGFALWDGHAWLPRGLWRIPPIWRPKNWKAGDDDHFPVTPASRPFWTIKITPNKPPLAVIVGDIWKYWQDHYVARYDPMTRNLVLLEEDKDPKVISGYLRLMEDSGHRATFTAWTFCQWTGEKLLPRGHWYDGLDQTEESSLLKAAVYNNNGDVEKSFVVTNSDTERHNALEYSVMQRDAPFAHLKFTFHKASDVENSDSAAEAFLFEKLTGLPRKLYPQNPPGKPFPRIEQIATVKVTSGSDEARKLFSN